MIIIGIDLSGPSNYQQTAGACFEKRGKRLLYSNSMAGADDRVIYDLISVRSHSHEAVIGLDAPLSYNIGGGDRNRDARLRRLVVEAGLPSGSVMTPTMTKMCHLTLRGISVARSLALIKPRPPRLVEVHPGAALALRGASVKDIRRQKEDASARLSLPRFLERQELEAVGNVGATSDHLISACAAALAAWA